MGATQSQSSTKNTWGEMVSKPVASTFLGAGASCSDVLPGKLEEEAGPASQLKGSLQTYGL